MIFTWTPLTGRHHVRLEQSALQKDVVVVQSLINSGQHGLCHLLSAIQVMIAIRQHLYHQNRHYSP